jgi:hypothetical protein
MGIYEAVDQGPDNQLFFYYIKSTSVNQQPQGIWILHQTTKVTVAPIPILADEWTYEDRYWGRQRLGVQILAEVEGDDKYVNNESLEWKTWVWRDNGLGGMRWWKIANDFTKQIKIERCMEDGDQLTQPTVVEPVTQIDLPSHQEKKKKKKKANKGPCKLIEVSGCHFPKIGKWQKSIGNGIYTLWEKPKFVENEDHDKASLEKLVNLKSIYMKKPEHEGLPYVFISQSVFTPPWWDIRVSSNPYIDFFSLHKHNFVMYQSVDNNNKNVYDVENWKVAQGSEIHWTKIPGHKRRRQAPKQNITIKCLKEEANGGGLGAITSNIQEGGELDLIQKKKMLFEQPFESIESVKFKKTEKKKWLKGKWVLSDETFPITGGESKVWVPEGYKLVQLKKISESGQTISTIKLVKGVKGTIENVILDSDDDSDPDRLKYGKNEYWVPDKHSINYYKDTVYITKNGRFIEDDDDNDKFITGCIEQDKDVKKKLEICVELDNGGKIILNSHSEYLIEDEDEQVVNTLQKLDLKKGLPKTEGISLNNLVQMNGRGTYIVCSCRGAHEGLVNSDDINENPLPLDRKGLRPQRLLSTTTDFDNPPRK